jgi:TolB-like protein/class 3 adenylate cyclase/Tfp pilus assembly protein PilF
MGQRHLETIMFTDIVGYSALAERNEALALQTLEKHWELLRSVFTKFDGHEIKTIGDAFLVEFPSALRAVEAGLAIQRTLEDYNRSIDEDHKIIIRIGIHLGDVERREGDVFGEGVNIASRIEPLAPSGGICISEPVYVSVRNTVDVPFYSMGEQKLKNISQPIVVYSYHPDKKERVVKTNFWQELRRRNVFKVGVTYAILAWLLMQLTVIAAPALQLPGWTLSLITYILIIGFPLILLFAWAFEMTPEGFKPTHQVQHDESITSMTGRKFDFIIIGLMATAIIFLVLDNYVLIEEASPPMVTSTTEVKSEAIAEAPVVADDKSIAVLPFANRSEEKKDAFFADGLHDDLLTHLSKISDMKVISRTSVMGYRDTQKKMKVIGDELGVATLLEGGVQRAGNQVRINVQLIDVNTDQHLWAEIYDRELTAANIFAIQSEIATAIANALKATLSPEEQARIATVPTMNLEAYDAYLLGKQRMAKRTIQGLAEAVDYFEQAITLDPAFALAYVGLSDSYQLQILYSYLPKDEMQEKAETAINKALSLDDKLGEAYASHGLLNQQKNDFLQSEVAYKKALELNPNYATAYHWYGTLLGFLGRDEEASAQMQKALSLDPLSIIINFNVANFMVLFGRIDEAMAQYEKMIEIDPTAHLGYFGKGNLYSQVYGRLDEAVPWFRRPISFDPNEPNHKVNLGVLYRDLGDDKQAECWFNQAIKLNPENNPANIYKSILHTNRNENDLALAHAQQAIKVVPDDWESLKIARNHDLRVSSYDRALSHYEKAYPALLTKDEPTIDRINYKVAIDLAYVLQLMGEKERAGLLLDRSLKIIHGGIPRYNYDGYGIADVQVYALQGKKQLALTALREAIDEGWSANWRYSLEHNPNLESIRNEPEFQAMLVEIKVNMARQLARVKDMEKEKNWEVCINP